MRDLQNGRGEESQTCSRSTGNQPTPRRSAADQAAIQFPPKPINVNPARSAGLRFRSQKLCSMAYTIKT